MGFWIQPRQRVSGELKFAVIGPNGLGLPLRLLTQREAEQIAALLNDHIEDELTVEIDERCRTLKS